MVLEHLFLWNCLNNKILFFHLSPTLSHLHPIQVENCDSNSRLVVDENDNGKFRFERVKTLKYFCINHGDQKVFSLWNHHKCLSWLFPLLFNTLMLWVYGHYKYINSLSAGSVFRRQNLTSEGGPRTAGVSRDVGFYFSFFYFSTQILGLNDVYL